MDMIFQDRDISSSLNEIQIELERAEGQYVLDPKDFKSDLADYIDSGGSQSGESLPWTKADGVQRLRQGEFSIWAGINGHGKSQLLSQVMLWRMKSQKVLIASLEMTPRQTLWRMCCQYAGCQASKEFALQTVDKFSGRLWIYDQLDSVQSDRLLALCHYAAKELKIDHIVIDSLMKCGMATDDYNAQKKFADRLQWAAKNLGVHIHLIAHARKGKTEYEMIDKFDISGSTDLTNIPDNIFLIHRNKRREDAVEKIRVGVAEGNLPAIEQKALDQPDCYLRIAKNRHGGNEGTIGLYFHKSSGQYTPSETTSAMKEPF